MSTRSVRVVLFAVSVAFLTALGACMSPAKTAAAGLVDGALAACPSSPNCVCSAVSVDATHAIEPFALDGNAADAIDALTTIIASMPRTRVVTASDSYLHAEFTSRILRFVDDVEFHVDPAHAVIHVRSASRVGHSDLGANRARVERLRDAWSNR